MQWLERRSSACNAHVIYLTNALFNHSTTLADIYNAHEYSSRRYSHTKKKPASHTTWTEFNIYVYILQNLQKRTDYSVHTYCIFGLLQLRYTSTEFDNFWIFGTHTTAVGLQQWCIHSSSRVPFTVTYLYVLIVRVNMPFSTYSKILSKSLFEVKWFNASKIC